MRYFKGIIIFLSLFVFFSIGISLEWKTLGPSARDWAPLTVDCANRRLILFGGGSYGLTGRWYNDAWQMPLLLPVTYFWFPLSVSGTPPPGRGGCVAAYDLREQRLIIFGGDTAWGNRVNDAWALNLNLFRESWERLNPTGTPPGNRSVAVGIYHPTRNSFILFGGDGNYYNWFNDVWELQLDNLNWREISVPGTKPAVRGAMGGFFDSKNNRMIIFGGCGNNTYYNDVWAINLTPGNESWTQLFTSGTPPTPRSAFVFAYSPKSNKFYIYGGWSSHGLLDDVWCLDLSNLSWAELTPSGQSPGGRRCLYGAFDFYNGNMIIFGGNRYTGYYFNETYFLNVERVRTEEEIVRTEEWKQTGDLPNPILLISSPSVNFCPIQFMIPAPQKVRVKIINVTGRIVKNLYSDYSRANIVPLLWDGTDENGEKVSSGAYICELELENESIRKKFVFTR
ncbi:MAG: hypothetical protein OEZ20_03625 [candidate division WOR-3 bacterium]|nr:hypothetical protein [candidate division WOR-3 bacterium]MDH5683537.1 hypothetical protein [candidate division WOR-3 bacterium]